MFSAITISLTPEAKGGPFVFWDDLDASCASAAQCGFDAVEIFARSADDLDVERLKILLGRHGLRLAALGTGAGWVVRKLRLTDPDAGVRKQAIDFISAIVDCAGALGAPAIIGSMQGRWEGGVARDQACVWMREALEVLGARAALHGVPLLLEPLNRYETNLFNRVSETLTFLASLRVQNVKLLCDLFHMNIEEANVADSLRTAGDKLGHLHFADSNRQAMGFGHTDPLPVARALREIGYAGAISAEILPLPDAMAAARQTIKAYRSAFGAPG